LIPAMGNFAHGEENSILILDNAPIHDRLEITRLVEEAGGIVIFTARYSPDINPIEYAFNLYKKLLKRFHMFDSELAHQLALGGITEEDLGKTFKRIIKTAILILNCTPISIESSELGASSLV
jgi:transposase